MAFTPLALGTTANDGTGDTLRAGGTVINANFVDAQSQLDGKQPLDAGLTSLAGLTGVGIVEATSTNVFALRALGVAASTSILTRADGDARFAALSHAHATTDITGLLEYLQDSVAAMLVAGTNMTLTYNDGAGTLTLDAAGGGGGGGAPTTAEYVVKTADGGLSAERVATDTAEIAWDWAIGGQAKLNLVAGSISLSKLANISANTLLGSVAGGAPAEISCTAAGRALLDDADAAAQRATLALGTAATLNVPASGDAASGEVVKGNDTRLTNARTPSSHASSHASGGADALTGNLDAVARTDVRKNSTGTVFSRRRLNLIEGSNVTITVADDSGNEEIDVTIAATGGGGGGGAITVNGGVTLTDVDLDDATPAAPSGGVNVKFQSSGSAPTNISAYVEALALIGIHVFGDGSDGDFTADGTASAPAWATKSGSNYTMTRDAYLDDLTISSTGNIITAGYRLFVNGVLDLTGAPTNAIRYNGSNGGNASGTGSGALASAGASQSIGGFNASTAGPAGTSAAGTQASAAPNGSYNGGICGASGAGGNGTNAGGALRTAPGSQGVLSIRYPKTDLIRGITLLLGGGSGPGGSAGGGDGTNSGGGGGGGGTGAGVVAVYARTISRGGSTGVGAISAKGGNGGNGGNSSAGNTGGGGGAGAGGGGWVYIVYGSLSGSVATDLIDVSGGTGGNGGNGTGTGIGGNGGTGGSGGRVTLIPLTAAASETFGAVGTTGSAGSGTTGGSGGAGNTTQVDL